ncbi:hypothetical protein MSZK_35820 [Mycobacterium sp. shizuoka-1]|nr:hypothetical protein MSZK_35820 [Mycobacterium sp. shizuoka-1]
MSLTAVTDMPCDQAATIQTTKTTKTTAAAAAVRAVLGKSAPSCTAPGIALGDHHDLPVILDHRLTLDAELANTRRSGQAAAVWGARA